MRDKQSHYEYIVRYVDDLLIDGTQENVLRFITLLRDRFECKDPETLTIKHSIDYVGINISLSKKVEHISRMI